MLFLFLKIFLEFSGLSHCSIIKVLFNIIFVFLLNGLFLPSTFLVYHELISRVNLYFKFLFVSAFSTASYILQKLSTDVKPFFMVF